jgi:hypothetical protein
LERLLAARLRIRNAPLYRGWLAFPALIPLSKQRCPEKVERIVVMLIAGIVLFKLIPIRWGTHHLTC